MRLIDQPGAFKDKIRNFLFRRTAWLLAGILLISFIVSGSLFYYEGWSVVGAELPIVQVELPLNQALWLTVLSSVNATGTPSVKPGEIKDIFNP